MKIIIRKVTFLAHFFLVATFFFSFYYAKSFQVEIKKLSDRIYRITIDGINAVAIIDSAGNTLLSDNFKDFHTPVLLDELQKIGSKKIVYVINTHFHKDHCGGNKIIKDATIISHENTKKELQRNFISPFWQDTSLAFPDYALPSITFNDKITISFGEEEIELISLTGGHTNSDIIVYFKKSKIIHLSDLLFSIGFPAIDFERGGSALKFAANLQNIIENYLDDLIFVAGHGKEFTKKELVEYYEMISCSVEIINKLISEGYSFKSIKEKKPLSSYKKWSKGYFTLDEWTENLYFDLIKSKY